MINAKKLEKLEKVLGEETVAALSQSQVDELERSIVKAEASVKEAQEELEANPKYQELKESLKALSEGLKDVKKRQRAIVQYALHLLEEKGRQ